MGVAKGISAQQNQSFSRTVLVSSLSQTDLPTRGATIREYFF